MTKYIFREILKNLKANLNKTIIDNEQIKIIHLFMGIHMTEYVFLGYKDYEGDSCHHWPVKK